MKSLEQLQPTTDHLIPAPSLTDLALEHLNLQLELYRLGKQAHEEKMWQFHVGAAAAIQPIADIDIGPSTDTKPDEVLITTTSTPLGETHVSEYGGPLRVTGHDGETRPVISDHYLGPDGRLHVWHNDQKTWRPVNCLAEPIARIAECKVPPELNLTKEQLSSSVAITIIDTKGNRHLSVVDFNTSEARYYLDFFNPKPHTNVTEGNNTGPIHVSTRLARVAAPVTAVIALGGCSMGTAEKPASHTALPPTDPAPALTTPAKLEQPAIIQAPTLPAETPEATATPTTQELWETSIQAAYPELSQPEVLPVMQSLFGYDANGQPVDKWNNASLGLLPENITVHTAQDGTVYIEVTNAPPTETRYPRGTIFEWRGDPNVDLSNITLQELRNGTLILTGRENTTIRRGEVAFGAASLNTWVRYDAGGNVLEFVDPAGSWISPLDLQEDGSFTFYTQEQIGPNGERQLAQTIWWANGGTPVELTAAPDGSPPTEFLGDGSQHQLTNTTIEGQTVPAIAAPDGTIQFTYNVETGTWQEATNPVEIFVQKAQELYGDQIGITFNPQDVEVDTDGKITIYSSVNGQRIEVVRTALNDDGSIFVNENNQIAPVFALETYALATSTEFRGGSLAGGRISIRYLPDVPVVADWEFIVINQAEVQAKVDAVLNVPSGLPVQNVLSAEQDTKNHLLTDESGTVRIEHVNVILGRIRNQLPGYRAMYTNYTTTGPGSGRSESYGYMWNPDQPEKITIMIYLEDFAYRNANTNDSSRNWLLMSSIIKGVALLQSTSRPVVNFPKHGIDVRSDINSVGNTFRELAIHNPREGKYMSIDYQVSTD